MRVFELFKEYTESVSKFGFRLRQSLGINPTKTAPYFGMVQMKGTILVGFAAKQELPPKV
jgi:hypothetical protein